MLTFEHRLPGDKMIHDYLSREAEKLHGRYLQGVASLDDWLALRPRLLDEYYYMLGLSPMPERTPLLATTTGTLDCGDYVVDNLHFQSRPGLYVTGNLYRPVRYFNRFQKLSLHTKYNYS